MTNGLLGALSGQSGVRKAVVFEKDMSFNDKIKVSEEN